MLRFCTLSAVVIAGVLIAGEPPAETHPVNVPTERIEKIQQLFQRPERDISQTKLAELLATRMRNVIQLGAKAEKQFPDAANLHLVRGKMLEAADFLARRDGGAAGQKQLLAIAARILKSKDPPRSKVPADYFVTRSKTRAVKGPDASKQIAKLITGLADRYAKTHAAAAGIIYATILARQYNQLDLREKFLIALETKHREYPGVLEFLRAAGRRPDIGHPFKAKLTRLDGTELNLPDELIGKVVLVEFWATWCPPCVAAVPHLKQVYSKYRDDGLEIVGVSLDTSRSDLARFVRDNNLTWIQTYTGKKWEDPTARKYGITRTPTMWLIGRDGNVLTDDAHGHLDHLVPEAIKRPFAPIRKK
jgi:thiol-disulfide isomerase/thioredoxin